MTDSRSPGAKLAAAAEGAIAAAAPEIAAAAPEIAEAARSGIGGDGGIAAEDPSLGAWPRHLNFPPEAAATPIGELLEPHREARLEGRRAGAARPDRELCAVGRWRQDTRRVVFEIREIPSGANAVGLGEWSTPPVGTIRTFPSASGASAFLVGFAEGRGLAEIGDGGKADG